MTAFRKKGHEQLTLEVLSTLWSFSRSSLAALTSSFLAAMWRAGRWTFPPESFSRRTATTLSWPCCRETANGVNPSWKENRWMMVGLLKWSVHGDHKCRDTYSKGGEWYHRINSLKSEQGQGHIVAKEERVHLHLGPTINNYDRIFVQYDISRSSNATGLSWRNVPTVYHSWFIHSYALHSELHCLIISLNPKALQ